VHLNGNGKNKNMNTMMGYFAILYFRTRFLFQIMVQSNTKNTDLDRIDTKEKELKKSIWGKIMYIPKKE
jgi:preprotein translocase subunit SecG